MRVESSHRADRSGHLPLLHRDVVSIVPRLVSKHRVDPQLHSRRLVQPITIVRAWWSHISHSRMIVVIYQPADLHPVALLHQARRHASSALNARADDAAPAFQVIHTSFVHLSVSREVCF